MKPEAKKVPVGENFAAGLQEDFARSTYSPFGWWSRKRNEMAFLQASEGTGKFFPRMTQMRADGMLNGIYRRARIWISDRE
jgi:hypothetical protein